MIIFGCFIFLFISVCFFVEYLKNKRWNNGVCLYCNSGFWKSFDMDSSGEVGYKCTNCGKTIWL